MRPTYTIREDVKASLVASYTSRDNVRIDAALEEGSDSVDDLTHRRFYPEIRTVKLDWPTDPPALPWRLDLESNEILEMISLTVAGVSVPLSACKLRRSDNTNEPPYDVLELDRDTDYVFQSGTTPQESIVISAVFGACNTRYSLPGAILPTGGITSGATQITVTPSVMFARIGVGSLLTIDDEWLTVLETYVADSGQNTGNALVPKKNDASVLCSDGTAFAYDNIISIGSERMRVMYVSGNSLIVERAVDGTLLGVHGTGSDIYVERKFDVERGVLGSTAASHTAGTEVLVQQYPALAASLAKAEALVSLEQQLSAYAKATASGGKRRATGGTGLDDIRQRTQLALGRVRSAAI